MRLFSNSRHKTPLRQPRLTRILLIALAIAFCLAPTDPSEKEAAFVCDDGADNDGDGALDYPADIGCKNPTWSTENPQCSDGIDNADNDDPPLADWDGAGMDGPIPSAERRGTSPKHPALAPVAWESS
jgi:hypothetical protein